MEKMKDLKLCYADKVDENHVALYFMNKDAKDVTGDDWDDIPYEHNAGTPYVREGDILEKLIITADCMSVIGDDELNSPYSVDIINNSKRIHWVMFEHWRLPDMFLMPNDTIADLFELQEENPEINLKIYKEI